MPSVSGEVQFSAKLPSKKPQKACLRRLFWRIFVLFLFTWRNSCSRKMTTKTMILRLQRSIWDLGSVFFTQTVRLFEAIVRPIETGLCDLLPEDFGEFCLQLLPFVIDISMLFVRGEDDLTIGGKQDKRRETAYRIQVRCRGLTFLRGGHLAHHGPGTRVLPKRVAPGIGGPVMWDADDEQASVVILLVQFHQHGERANATAAPRCPEVEQNILPLACIFGEVMHGAVGQLGLKIDERLAYDC